MIESHLATPPLLIKICGITNLEDALHAVSVGADLLGFILYPKSPRYVTPTQVGEIVSSVKAILSEKNSLTTSGEQPKSFTSLRFVGVFVNTPIDQVSQILVDTQLDYAQLHGDEPLEMLAQLNGRGYKAIRPKDIAEALRQADSFAPLSAPDGPALLVDAYHPTLYGGAGQAGDWQIAAAVAKRAPRLLLAGGLTADNVAGAIQSVRPWGVDVSSGVEAAPGKKDHTQVVRFIANVRAAARQQEE